MKKGTIATIIGVTLVLGLVLIATPSYASDWIDGLKIYPDCHCGMGAGCSCRMVTVILPQCDMTDLLNYIRDLESYYGEDDNYVYLKATETNDQYEPDSDGSVLMGYPKTYLENWVNSGCTGGF